VHDAARHDHALPGRQLERALALDVEQQRAVEDEEQLVLAIVLVPVELALEPFGERRRRVPRTGLRCSRAKRGEAAKRTR
jgi:hypothetical protein